MIKNKESGFTLIEMMIAIAIIGVLAAITVPNFKKYQAKSKIVEAKMQLASAYTAETSFMQLFDMYATCLDYMGYDPVKQTNARYFAIGFPNFTSNINLSFYTSAVGERLVTSECPRDIADVDGVSVFLANKAIGSNKMDNIADFRSATPITSNVLNDVSGPFSDQVHAGLGTQEDHATKTFTIAAAGYIDSTAVTPDTSCLWTINQDKKLTNFRTGY